MKNLPIFILFYINIVNNQQTQINTSKQKIKKGTKSSCNCKHRQIMHHYEKIRKKQYSKKPPLIPKPPSEKKVEYSLSLFFPVYKYTYSHKHLLRKLDTLLKGLLNFGDILKILCFFCFSIWEQSKAKTIIEVQTLPNTQLYFMAGLQQYNFFPTDLFYPRPQPQQSPPKPNVLPLQTPISVEDQTQTQQPITRSMIKASATPSTSAMVFTHKKQSFDNKKVPKFSPNPISWMVWMDEEKKEEESSASF